MAENPHLSENERIRIVASEALADPTLPQGSRYLLEAMLRSPGDLTWRDVLPVVSRAQRLNLYLPSAFIYLVADVKVEQGPMQKPFSAIASVVLGFLVGLTGIAHAETQGQCYAKCYAIAKPCDGRAECNIKSNGCYDRCDRPPAPAPPVVVASLKVR